MADVEKLSEQELQQVAGGNEAPEGVKPKYHPGDIVTKKFSDLILKIDHVIHWGNETIGFWYDVVILESDETLGHFCPGKHMNISEDAIEHKKYGI